MQKGLKKEKKKVPHIPREKKTVPHIHREIDKF